MELKGFMAALRGAVETGSRVEAMRESFSWRCAEKRFRASRGPKTSRASNAGKRRTPKLEGTVGGR